MSDLDLLIIGAGSAGMAAAVTAAARGLSVEVIEERASAGGNLHHQGNREAGERAAPHAPDHARGKELRARFERSGATLTNGTFPWRIEPDGSVALAGEARDTRSPKFTLIATGAMERPVAFPGWTLPGVMGAGAAQLLLKGSGIVPSGKIVLAGAGPLLYLVAWQLLQVGATPSAILDSSKVADRFAALPALLGVRDRALVFRGLAMLRELRRAGVKFHRVESIRATGEASVETVVAATASGPIDLPADVLLVHDGVIPATQLSRLAGCTHVWDETQQAHKPVTDEWGMSSSSALFVAGDCGGIGGGKAAEARGAIAALAIAEKLGLLSAEERDRKAAPHRKSLDVELRLRRFLDALYPPRLSTAGLEYEDTVVCRCENVTAGQLREAIAAGADGPSKLKPFTRAGMGPCQGRMCGPNLVRLLNQEKGLPETDLMLNIRAPLKPVSLGEIAGLEQ
ncbi:MAG: FAD/NAD(P)-binding oxidoreductase [Rhizobiales bacterium]|nr:FAD/NAD(P)-binding oxidoreductase [Hyphomicrobiales bacterium]MBA68415.1 FAD/NAD(P)-binding oxidoreductase [Hyphomicrobiales bacterium]|tara:strand:- start:2019 stop:3386 length:1368 start_codon:yes stop_codon:yes gene_type:complete